MRIFGSEKLAPFLERLGLKDGQAIEHKMISKAIENSQKKVEGHNFDIRKNLIDYDNVMNKQRELVYGYRKMILHISELDEMQDEIIFDIESLIRSYIEDYIPEKLHSINWDIDGLLDVIKVNLDVDVLSIQFMNIPDHKDKDEETLKGSLVEDFRKLSKDELLVSLVGLVKKQVDLKISSFPDEDRIDIVKALYLQAADSLWKDALTSLDSLKEGIGLRGYAQVNPLIEYQKEAYELFINMQFRMKEEAINSIMTIRLEESLGAGDIFAGAGLYSDNLILSHDEILSENESKQKPIVKPKKIGRNEPCPCGSGKKYKHCHGKN